HSQHATLQLNTESFQLFTLDSIAQNQSLRLQYVAAYRAYQATLERLNTLKANAKQAGTEADYQQFLFDELANAKLEPGEQEQLETEQQQLEHAEEIKRNLFGTAHALQEQEINAVGLLKDALSLLQQAERHMPSLSVQAERL